MSIFTQSRHKEESWQFIKYLFTPEVQTRLYEAALTNQDTYLPPNKKTWDVLQMDGKFKRVLVDQANDAKGPPPVANWDTNSRFVDEAIQKVVLKKSDPQKELARADIELERMLKK